MLRVLNHQLCRHTKISRMSMFSTHSYQLPEPVDTHTALRYRLTPEQVENLPATLRPCLTLNNASQNEVNKVRIARAIEAFQRFPGDTGSSEVQIAVLTQKISYLTEHMQQHRKDVHSRRGLVGMVNKRKSLLNYLKKKDLGKFKAVVSTLNLRYR